ncbi:peptide-methionine (S)-S-oxide reductase MsrA [bacterium]|nr:peptide-methionine (S)-S-oxide reductase MsrA [bacterium]
MSDDSKPAPDAPAQTPAPTDQPAKLESIVLGGGCFWCTEAVYEELLGVEKVTSGYAGGHVPNPSYEQVLSGITGHAEVIEITYDPAVIKPEDLLHVFFTIHDPTTLNQQGPDFGTQYRSVIFVSNEQERERALKIMKEVADAKVWRNPIVTTIEPLRAFYPAEGYHQDYYRKFKTARGPAVLKMNAGYCRAVIEPKVAKFRKKYAEHLKKKPAKPTKP